MAPGSSPSAAEHRSQARMLCVEHGPLAIVRRGIGFYLSRVTGNLAMSPGSSSILLVEDDQDIRESVSELLELEGYTTVTTINGREALEQLHRMDKPCLILLDVMMPVMDGHAFMKKIQEEQPLSEIPVVVMSASHKPPAGAKGYLSKPLDIDELLGWVRSCCGGTSCARG